MSAITKILGATIAAAALAGTAPAAAQYYPGYGNPYGHTNPYGYSPYGYGNNYGNGYGYGPQGYGYGANNQVMVSQCTSAVEARLGGGYGGYGASPYGGPYGGGRVLGVSRVEPGRDGGFTVRGVATSGYSYGYAPNSPNLVWACRTDFRGVVIDVDVERARTNNGYGSVPGSYDYSPYGYERY